MLGRTFCATYLLFNWEVGLHTGPNFSERLAVRYWSSISIIPLHCEWWGLCFLMVWWNLWAHEIKSGSTTYLAPNTKVRFLLVQQWIKWAWFTVELCAFNVRKVTEVDSLLHQTDLIHICTELVDSLLNSWAQLSHLVCTQYCMWKEYFNLETAFSPLRD